MSRCDAGETIKPSRAQADLACKIFSPNEHARMRALPEIFGETLQLVFDDALRAMKINCRRDGQSTQNLALGTHACERAGFSLPTSAPPACLPRIFRRRFYGSEFDA